MIDSGRRWFESLPVRGKLVVTLAVQLAVLTVGCLSFLIVQREVALARGWTNHTHLVIELVEALRAEAIAQQTGIRGFVISGRRVYLEPYTLGVEQFETLSSQLNGLLADNAQQQARLRRIEALMREWQEQVAAPRLQGQVARSADMGVDGVNLDKRLIDTVKELCADIIAQERSILAEREAGLQQREKLALALTLLLLLVGWFTGVRAVRTLHRGLGQPLSELAALVPRLAGAAPVEVPFRNRRDEVGVMSAALEQLRQSSVEQGIREWVAEQSARILSALQGCSTESEFSETLLARLCSVLDAGYGLAYRWNEDSALLEFSGAYGLPDTVATRRRFRLGEGLVGQCVVERRVIELRPVPDGYLRVVSGLGASLPHSLALFPLSARGQTVAVIELGLLRDPRRQDRALVAEVLSTAGLAWYSLSRSLKTRELLAESQARTEELHASEEALRLQQDKLRSVNEALRARSNELEEQGRRLSLSEREMREQAQELRRANEMLEERTRTLSLRQKELELARSELERKAADLERASRYKSEFLANMSHELRTPLNSMLILSRMLADNPGGNLDSEQVESAQIVHDSGQSLLALINDILDLSKVEAGKMQLSLEDVNVRDCLRVLAARYRPLATQRDLAFVVQVDDDVPAHIHSDGARLSQILGNLLSNALKFTHRGSVTLRARRDGAQLRLGVRDTGIGIPQDQLARVFEAFEQADSGTSRRYGGTGLGLSIVNGMASLLGGEVKVESREGEGSEFSLLLPLHADARTAGQGAETAQTGLADAAAVSAPALIGPPALLIVEDDADMAAVLAAIAGRRGLDVISVGTGAEALEHARRRRLVGVLLDIGLPDISGWTVLEALKRDPATRDVPVHIVSGRQDSERGMALGAAGFLHKPVSRAAVVDVLERMGAGQAELPRRILVVDDDAQARRDLVQLLIGEAQQIVEAATIEEGLRALATQTFDGLVLDPDLDGTPGLDLLIRAKGEGRLPPVVIHSHRELTPEDQRQLREYTDRIVIESADSAQRLLHEVTLLLHPRQPDAAAAAQPQPHAPVADLAGKTVMVVDDDMRNVFALSKALRGYGLKVVIAQDGHKSLALLDSGHDIDLVLMDIMMPGMDGYEVIRRIRAQPQHQALPIIAVTAKAMKGDREKCLDAGANDYCAKPIDLEQLLSLMQVWI